jgi:hypothetical protein
MISKSDIMKALVFMGPDDLVDIKTRTDFLLGSNRKSEEIKDEEQLFYDAVSEQLKVSTGSVSYYYSVYKKTPQFKKLKEAKEFVDRQLSEFMPEATKAQQVQFYMLFARILLDYLNSYAIPKSLSSIFNSYQKFPAHLDKAFPGYGRSGAFEMVLARSGDKRYDT